MYAIKVIDKKALKGKEDSLENEIRVLRRYGVLHTTGSSHACRLSLNENTPIYVILLYALYVVYVAVFFKTAD